MTLVLGVLLIAGVALYIGGPILRPRTRTAGRGRGASAVDARHEILLRELAELEYDYRMGKVGHDDYRQQRAGLTRQI